MNFIDLFAGAGGLSEGFYQKGFNALVHLEIDKWACETLKTRMDFYGYKDSSKRVLQKDITDDDTLQVLDNIIKDEEVDVIIGGPPCQAYSTLGRAKDENGMQNDPRNFLFEHYVKVLNHYKPKFFVFENVTGMLTAKIKDFKITDDITAKLGEFYNISNDLNTCVLNSVNYGVPQIRKRVILIGVRKDINIDVEDIYSSIKITHNEVAGLNNSKKDPVTVKEAIYDLPFLYPGEGNDNIEFTYKLDNEYLKKIGDAKLQNLRHHVARKHNEKDIERYKYMALNKWTYKELLENKSYLDHEKPRVFSNSYTVQFWDKPSRTIIAHLYKDGNQFIHPDYRQNRTLTPREAARLQSFPDNFIFEGSRTESYKQIGNAVPPLMAEAIAEGLLSVLKRDN
ncbi:DNA cytosine methyltransferase [Streptococcus suis]